VPDVRGGRPGGREIGDPLADVDGQDVGHLHLLEPRDDLAVQDVAVALARRRLQHVMREPLLVDVGGERQPARGRIAGTSGANSASACCQARLACLRVGEGASMPDAPARIAVDRRVLRAPALSRPLAAEPHRAPP